jgi:hypothetical protein
MELTRLCNIKSAEPIEGQILRLISGGQLQEPALQLMVKYVED